MWSFYRAAGAVAATALGLAAFGAAGHCQQQQQYVVNQNQTGLQLPAVQLPNGFDEVRSSTGTTCRSAIGSNGAYADVGVVGGGFGQPSANVAAYGRVVIPLGPKPKRINCKSLYDLEIERLRLEVKMLKRGLNAKVTMNPGDKKWETNIDWNSGKRR